VPTFVAPPALGSNLVTFEQQDEQAEERRKELLDPIKSRVTVIY